MVIIMLRRQNRQGEPDEGGQQPLLPHHLGELDVEVAVVIH